MKNCYKFSISVLILFFLINLTFISCGKSSNFKSPATGWNVNDKKGGFYFNTNYKKQTIAPGMVLIEGGTFTKGKIQDDVLNEQTNGVSRQHVQSFYMDETEVTNLMYLEYLYWIKKVFPPESEKYSKIYFGVVPDTLVWRNRLGFNEAMTENYLRHPAYADYPVVGVNWIQANEFASWRTNRLNENILENKRFTAKDTKMNHVDSETTFDTETYFASPTSVYGGKQELTMGGVISQLMLKRKKVKDLYVQRYDGFLSPEYRLPTESEWEYAATAEIEKREFNNIKGQKKYPWSGKYTRNNKRKVKGDQLANFKQSKGDYGGIAGWSDDGADITNMVRAYEPNSFGLYDMAGNVAEWVADIYRPITDDEVSDFNYFRGNVFKKNKLNTEGKFEISTAETLEYDTLRNGKIIARNLPGQIVRERVNEDDTFLRTNYDKSYNINYRDGDQQSTRFFKKASVDGDKIDPKEIMYNAPIHGVKTDSLGKMLKKVDSSNKRSTLVNDEVRIYKGGSWQDRAYWLDPAQRRYLSQELATDFIGFRCAMSSVDPKSDNKKTKSGYNIIRYRPKTKKEY